MINAKFNIWSIFLLLTSVFVFTVPSAVAQRLNIGLPFIRHFSADDYQGGIQNWSITQDKRGFLYVANNFGMLEYDGAIWKRFQVINGSKVRDILVADNGYIYLASQGDFGYFSPDRFGSLVYTSLADSLATDYRNFDETWKVFRKADQTFFCTFTHIFIYDESGIRVVKSELPPEDFFFVNHRLYVSALGGGLFMLDGEELKLINKGDFFKDKTIASIIPWSGEELLITTTNDGIYVFDGYDLSPWQDAPDALKNYDYNCAIRLRNGNYVFGTENNGLIIVDQTGQLLLHLNKGKGLNDRKVLSLFQDNQDNLWVGHNNGISYIELDLPFTFINEEIGLPGTGYSGYLENDHLYLGTSNGLYVKDINDAALDSYQLIPSTEGQVYEVREVDNQVLLGHHDGSFVVSPQSTSKLSDELGAWTFLPLKSRPNYMIGGTYKGLQLFKKVGNKWVYENHIEGFTESCRVLEEDADGNIWMTHGYKGVFKLTLTEDLQRVDKIAFYGSEGGLPSNILINVYNIRNEFVFTTEEDIYKYNQANDQFQPHEFYQPFFKPNDPVSVMAQDVFENVYFISKNSVGILTKNSSGEYEKTTDVFNKIKNMMNDDLQNVNILNGTYALFGAKEGFILYDHRKNNSRDYTYQTHIRQVNLTNLADSAIFNGNYFYKNTITGNQPENYVYELPYSENSLRIMFSAPFMDGLEKTEYQFKLENFDDVWSSWQNKTEKEYTNLKEGKYMFKVRAKNYFGKISSEATFDFTIMPPWYRTSLAFLSYGLVAIGFLFIAFKLLDRKHKKEKRILSIESSKQLNRKEIELKNITEQSEAEIEHLRNEKLKSEIAHKNKELATSTVHLLNKNGFIMGIKGTLSGVRKKSKNTEVKSELNRIIQDIERNISHDKDWEHFEFHFDQVHGNFSKKLKEKHPDLSPQEMKISAFLRMNLSTKEIANMLNISVRGVEISRYRLRKRLGIQRSVNLIEYLMGF